MSSAKKRGGRTVAKRDSSEKFIEAHRNCAKRKSRFPELAGIPTLINGKSNPEYRSRYKELRGNMPWQTTIPEERWSAIITHLQSGATIREACRITHIDNSNFYRRMICDADFKARALDALSIQAARISFALYESAVNGSFSAQKFFLERRNPEIWGPKRPEPRPTRPLPKGIISPPTPEELESDRLRRIELEKELAEARGELPPQDGDNPNGDN
jgi:hypothetical protein